MHPEKTINAIIEFWRNAIGMPGENGEWRDRLRAAVVRDGRKWATISKAAGLSRAYLKTILAGGKTPSIDSLAAVCKEINASLSWVIEGIELDLETERLLKAWARFPKEQRDYLLEFLAREPNKKK